MHSSVSATGRRGSPKNKHSKLATESDHIALKTTTVIAQCWVGLIHDGQETQKSTVGLPQYIDISMSCFDMVCLAVSICTDKLIFLFETQ